MLTEKEKRFLYDLLCKADWTYAEIVKDIIEKLQLCSLGN